MQERECNLSQVHGQISPRISTRRASGTRGVRHLRTHIQLLPLASDRQRDSTSDQMQLNRPEVHDYDIIMDLRSVELHLVRRRSHGPLAVLEPSFACGVLGAGASSSPSLEARFRGLLEQNPEACSHPLRKETAGHLGQADSMLTSTQPLHSQQPPRMHPLASLPPAAARAVLCQRKIRNCGPAGYFPLAT